MTNPSARAYLARQFEIINQHEPGSLSSIDEGVRGWFMRQLTNMHQDGIISEDVMAISMNSLKRMSFDHVKVIGDLPDLRDLDLAKPNLDKMVDKMLNNWGINSFDDLHFNDNQPIDPSYVPGSLSPFNFNQIARASEPFDNDYDGPP